MTLDIARTLSPNEERIDIDVNAPMCGVASLRWVVVGAENNNGVESSMCMWGVCVGKAE